MTLGLYSAQRLAPCLIQSNSSNNPLALEPYYQNIGRGYETFEKIIDRFYRPGWAETTFFMNDKPDDLEREITTILAGDVWRYDNQFQNNLLKR